MNFIQLETNTKTANEDNLIPLINVVFLMLIFFMVAGVIRETDSSGIKHPASSTTKALAKETLTLVVAKDESIVLDEQVLNYENLSSQLKRIISTKEKVADLYVVLRVDSGLPSKSLHRVLKSIREAGLLKVQLLTELGAAV